MFDQLQALGLGIVIFAIIVGVGTVILTNFGSSVAGCNADFVWNASSESCMNSTGGELTETAGLTNSKYLLGQLGTSGLAGWTPAIVALSVGLLFIGAFLFKKGGSKGRY